MKKYIINDKQRFTQILKKEGLTDDKIKEFFSINKEAFELNISITYRMNDIGGVVEDIIDNITGEEKRRKEFNPYEKSLIGKCFNHFLGFRNDIEKDYIIVEDN